MAQFQNNESDEYEQQITKVDSRIATYLANLGGNDNKPALDEKQERRYTKIALALSIIDAGALWPGDIAVELHKKLPEDTLRNCELIAQDALKIKAIISKLAPDVSKFFAIKRLEEEIKAKKALLVKAQDNLENDNGILSHKDQIALITVYINSFDRLTKQLNTALGIFNKEVVSVQKPTALPTLLLTNEVENIPYEE